uniref:CMP/dCMP-type deaminase domain-containing protein n=1 Tax=viral metagenome TaxID=1070528 RepID=A0A6C0D7G6_9ZZZZ
MNLLLSSFLEDKAIANLVSTYKTSVHVAFLVKRNKVISVATNRVGTRSRGCGYSDCTIHAEKNVVKQLGDFDQLRGASLYVFRISKCRTKFGMDKIVNSEPCYDCHLFLEKCVKSYGLRRVFYSTNEFVELDFTAAKPIRKLSTPPK